MQPDVYSSGFKMHQMNEFEQLKRDFQEESSNLLSRNHRLHLETSRRRKAYAQRKKAQMEKEERRYQMILAKRRQLIQEATEKFQRTHVTTKNNSIKGGSTKADYTLEETLRLIRGGRLTPPAHSIRDYTASRRPASVHDDMIDDSRQGLRSSRSLFEQQLSHHQHMLASRQQSALRDFAEAAMRDSGAAPKKIADTVSFGIGGQNASAKIGAVAQQPAGTSSVVPQHIGTLKDERQSTGAGSIGIAVAVPQYSNSKKNHDEHCSDSGQELDSLMLCDSLEVATLKQTDFAENQGHLGMERFVESVDPLTSKPRPWHLHCEVHNSNSNSNNNNMALTDKQNVGSLAVDRTSIANKVVNSIFSRADLLPHNDTGAAKENYRPNSGVSGGLADPSFPPQVNTGVQNIIPKKPLVFGVSGSPLAGPSGEPTSTVGFLLHRNANSQSSNIAVVQPTCHTNILNVYEEQRNSKPEPSNATLGLVDGTNTSLGNETRVAKLNGGINENGKPSERTSDLAPGQTVPDLGTFFFSGGLPPTAKPQVIAPKSHGASSVVASDSSVGSLVAHATESAITGNRSVMTENEDLLLNAAAVNDKPPTGQHKSGGVVGHDLSQADTIKHEARFVSVREKQWDIQSETTRQPDGLEGDLQRIALRPLDTNQKVTSTQNNASLNNNTQSNKPNAAFSDDTYSDEASSNLSASAGRGQTLTAKVPKGILKSRPCGCPASDGRRSQLLSSIVKSSGNTTDTMSRSFLDSLEVIKLHRKDDESIRPTEKNQKPSKKSVHFAEILCEEEPSQPVAVTGSQGAQIFFIPRPPLQGKTQIEPSASSRPTRPISAKVQPVTSPMDPDVKVPRVSSAGVMRRGPFYNPTAHSNSAQQQPASTSNLISTQASASLGTHQVTVVNSPSTFAASGKREQQTRDVSGISLDRTPTEEEISWLWQRVRNCLNREPSSTSATNSSRIPVVGNGSVSTALSAQLPSRQTATVSCATFDGSTLTSQLGPGRTKTTYINNFAGPQYGQCPAKRITMEMLDASAKKINNSLPQQQRVIHPNVSTAVASNDPYTGEPRATNVVGKQHTSSNSQVTSATGRNPVSSALSVEEERLMESIDRLNEKLVGYAASHQQYSNHPLVNRPPVPKPRSFASIRENPAGNS